MAVSSWKMSLIILLSLSQGIICQSIEISPKYQIAKVGEAVTLMCKVSKKVQYCRFEFHGENALSLGPTKKVDSDIIYAGAGFDKGECGATLKRAAERHNGLVKCTVGLFDETVEPWATMNLVIAHTPSPPELHLIEDNNRYYKEGDTLLATCAVKNGRPVANITWYIDDQVIVDGLSTDVITVKEELHTMSLFYFLDDQVIVDGLSTDVITVKEELHTILQNVSHVIVASDDGKQLRCVADHPGLSAANNYAQQIINVQYKPKPLDEPLEHFGLVEGAEGRIAVVVQANPKPTFYWTIGNKEYYEENHDDRFSVQKSVHKEDGSWESVLVINSLTKEDVEQNYGLTATNELGVTTYQVKISTSPRPKVLEIGTETIIIVIVAVFLLAIMFVTVFYARSRGQWCFAGGDAEKEVSPPEGTENPAVTHHPSTEYINNSPEMKKEKPKEDTPV